MPFVDLVWYLPKIQPSYRIIACGIHPAHDKLERSNINRINV